MQGLQILGRPKFSKMIRKMIAEKEEEAEKAGGINNSLSPLFYLFIYQNCMPSILPKERLLSQKSLILHKQKFYYYLFGNKRVSVKVRLMYRWILLATLSRKRCNWHTKIIEKIDSHPGTKQQWTQFFKFTELYLK